MFLVSRGKFYRETDGANKFNRKRSALQDETISNERSYRRGKQLEAVSKIDGFCTDIYRGYFAFRVSQGAEFYRRMRSAELRAR